MSLGIIGHGSPETFENMNSCIKKNNSKMFFINDVFAADEYFFEILAVLVYENHRILTGEGRLVFIEHNILLADLNCHTNI